MPLVLEHILSYLDHKSLRNVQQVCQSWNITVNSGYNWKKQLQREVSMHSFDVRYDKHNVIFKFLGCIQCCLEGNKPAVANCCSR